MKFHLAVVAWVVSLGFAAAAPAEDPPADLVMLHGRIHTEDADRSVAQALAIRGNKIVAVGTDQVERTTGSLEPGKLGDLIVLDRDIFSIDPFDLHSTRVLATYLDGREVYADTAQ